MNATEKQITFINSLMTTLKSKDWNTEYLYWLNLVDFSHLTDKQASRVINLLKSYNNAFDLIDAALSSVDTAGLFGEKAAAVIAFMNSAIENGIEFEDITTAFMAYRSENFAARAPEGDTGYNIEGCQAEIDRLEKEINGLENPGRLTSILRPEYRQNGARLRRLMIQEWQRGKQIAEAYGRYYANHPNHFQVNA